jgi:hypothetical protein
VQRNAIRGGNSSSASILSDRLRSSRDPSCWGENLRKGLPSGELLRGSLGFGSREEQPQCRRAGLWHILK